MISRKLEGFTGFDSVELWSARFDMSDNPPDLPWLLQTVADAANIIRFPYGGYVELSPRGAESFTMTRHTLRMHEACDIESCESASSFLGQQLSAEPQLERGIGVRVLFSMWEDEDSYAAFSVDDAKSRAGDVLEVRPVIALASYAVSSSEYEQHSRRAICLTGPSDAADRVATVASGLLQPLLVFEDFTYKSSQILFAA